MKICVTAEGPALDSAVDARFGRCGYFIFIDPSTMQFESFENGSAGASGGAGVQSAKFVADKGVKTVLTGNIGPKAFGTLNAAGVEVITVAAGNSVEETVRSFVYGNSRPVKDATAPAHSGLKG